MKTRLAALFLIATSTIAFAHPGVSPREMVLEIRSGAATLEASGDIDMVIAAAVGIHTAGNVVTIHAPATLRVTMKGAAFKLRLQGTKPLEVDMIGNAAVDHRLRLTGTVLELEGDGRELIVRQAASINKL